MSEADLAGHFSLGMLRRVMSGFSPPTAAFDPAGAWVNDYTFYTLIHNNRRNPVYGIPAGSLRLSRKNLPSGRIQLAFDYRKFLKGESSHRIAGEIECASDPLSTPLGWEYLTEIAPPEDASLSGLQFRSRMQARDRELEFTSGKGSRRIPKPESYSCLWSMFDAVQRLARDSKAAHRFTFLDRLHTPRPGHLLRYRETVRLGELRLHGFEQLGEGVIPSVFWTDDGGRLLLFSYGITGFVLDSKGEAK